MKSITLSQEESYCKRYRYPTVIIAWIADLSLTSIDDPSLPLGVSALVGFSSSTPFAWPMWGEIIGSKDFSFPLLFHHLSHFF